MVPVKNQIAVKKGPELSNHRELSEKSYGSQNEVIGSHRSVSYIKY